MRTGQQLSTNFVQKSFFGPLHKLIALRDTYGPEPAVKPEPQQKVSKGSDLDHQHVQLGIDEPPRGVIIDLVTEHLRLLSSSSQAGLQLGQPGAEQERSQEGQRAP